MYFILAQLDHWVLLLEVLLHCHIVDMVAQELAESHELMQKVQCALGFLVPGVSIVPAI